MKLFQFITFIIVSLLVQSSVCVHYQQKYFIDPSSSGSEQTGDFEHPFRSISSAFLKANSFLSEIPKDDQKHSFELSFYCKEGTKLTEFDPQVDLSVNNPDQFTDSLVLITSYAGRKTFFPKAKEVNFVFNGQTQHLTFRIPNTRLFILGVIFEFHLKESSKLPEIILQEGSKSEVYMSDCLFHNSHLDFQNDQGLILNLKASHISIERCAFQNLYFANHFLQVSQDQSLQFKGNKLTNVTIKELSFFKATHVTTISFTDNKIQSCSGVFLEVDEGSSGVIYRNDFQNIYSPSAMFQLKSIKKLSMKYNNFVYDNSLKSTSSNGLFSIRNFKSLEIVDILIQGYHGSESPIFITLENSFPESEVLDISETKFLNNNLILDEETSSRKLSLIQIDIQKKISINLNKNLFSGNSIASKQTKSKKDIKGSSTILLKALDSKVKLSQNILKNNSASRELFNLYLETSKLEVSSSVFLKNSLLKEEKNLDLLNDPQIIFRNFFWAGESIQFLASLFQGNYADDGGAINLYEIGDQKIPSSCSIHLCNFTQNSAKIGGAIFSNITKEKLPFISLKGNRFQNNQAELYPNYNPNAKFMIEGQLEIFNIFIQGNQTKIYKQKELIIENVSSGKRSPNKLSFFLAESIEPSEQPFGEFLTTLSIKKTSSSSEEFPISLKEGFINKTTGTNITLDSLTITAPPGSTITLEVTMQDIKNSLKIYNHEFTVQMNKNPPECERGQIFSFAENRCTQCPSGTFSLQHNSKECQKCPQGANCSLGGDALTVLPGYWRDTTKNENIEIYACQDPKEKCLGGEKDLCDENYSGNLCETCQYQNINGARSHVFTSNKCKACNSSSFMDLVINIAAFCLPFIFLIYTLSNILTSKSDLLDHKEIDPEKFSKYIELSVFLSFIQQIYILQRLDYIFLPESLDYLIQIFVSPSLAIFGYLTCFVSNITQFNILALYFALLFTKTSITLGIVKLRCQSYSSIRNTILALTWLFFLESPGLLDLLLDLSHCHKLGDITYSKYYQDLECNSQDFRNIQNFIFLPILIFVTFIIPLIITYLFTRSKLRSDNVQSQQKLKLIIFAKFFRDIQKSERSWMFFYFSGFGKLALLLLLHSHHASLFGHITIVCYFILLIILNLSRKVFIYQNWKKNILLVNQIILLIVALVGYQAHLMNEGMWKNVISSSAWIGIVVFIVLIFICNKHSEQAANFNRYKEHLDDDEFGDIIKD